MFLHSVNTAFNTYKRDIYEYKLINIRIKCATRIKSVAIKPTRGAMISEHFSIRDQCFSACLSLHHNYTSCVLLLFVGICRSLRLNDASLTEALKCSTPGGVTQISGIIKSCYFSGAVQFIRRDERNLQ